jgi:KAP family P-loop domain
MILTDNETRVDLLNNEAIASTIIKLLRDRPEHPVTIGVHGDWGAGKSSVLEMIYAALDGKEDVLCIKFNGWRFQGFEDAKIALIEGLVTELIEKRPTLTRAADTVKNIFRRIDWLKVARKAGGLAFTAFSGIPTPDQLRSALSGLENIVQNPLGLATPENLDLAISEVQSILKPAEATRNVPEEVGEFRKAFDELLKAAGVKQLIVLVDDLDRCLPDTAIETLEAIRLFVFTSKTAFVIAADEAMVEYSVRKHFPDLPETTGPRDYAKNYLEKLIQVPFRIPALGETETRIYVTLLLVGNKLPDGDEAFLKLVDIARGLLRRPWMSQGLDAGEVRQALGESFSLVDEEIRLSDQVGSILASGTKGNPRQIKRFLNSLILRHRTAEARGFGDEIKVPVLAKLMLAERFLPRLFDQIASAAVAHPTGFCIDLVHLEETADRKPKPSTPRRKTSLEDHSADSVGKASVSEETPERQESVSLTEWVTSEQILEWARIKPDIAFVDLRPYLFVAKDRKNYFGATSALGKLALIVDRLLGPKLAVQAVEPDLRKLANAEAAQVFELLRLRIISSDKFDSEPQGVPGLASLVRTHPTLQPDLLSFLESLPVERLGPWAVTGWVGVIKSDEEKERLQKLLQRWSASKNSKLKPAALYSLNQMAKSKN